jgi:hypothetical protein
VNKLKIRRFPTIEILILAQGISLFLWWIAGSYFGVDVYASRVFPGNDGWCVPEREGLGIHCWGDFYHPASQAALPNPFAGDIPVPYSGAGLLPFLFFSQISYFFGVPGLGLFLYLGTMAFLITYSIWFATRGATRMIRVILTSVLVLFSPGILFVLDRGNSAGFLIPILIWVFHEIKAGKTSTLVLSLIVLSAVKPHFGLFAIVLFLVGKHREAMFSGLGSAIINLAPFALFWPHSFPANVSSWISAVTGFQNIYGTVSAPWPQNISFSQSIYVFAYGLNALSNGAITSALTFTENNQGIFGPIVLLMAFLLIFVLRRTLTFIQITIIGMSAITMTSSISFFYYSVIAIPFILTLHSMTSDFDFESKSVLPVVPSETAGHSRINFVLMSSSVATLLQFPIPGFRQGDIILGSGIFIGGIWIVAYFAIAVVSYKSKSRGLSKALRRK